jgi:hypothetical protein
MADKNVNTFKGPTYMYGPKGEAEIFNDSTLVPEGWLDSADKFKPADPEKVKQPTGAAAVPMTREEIIVALKAGNVAFKGNAGTQGLYAALLDALKAHCLAQEIAVPEGATAPDLLKLLEVNPAS